MLDTYHPFFYSHLALIYHQLNNYFYIHIKVSNIKYEINIY